MSIYDMKLSQNDAAKAAGVTPKTVQNWVTREYLVGHRSPTALIEGGGVQGRNRLFTFHSVMQIAMMDALLQAGMGDLKSVANAAANFAHGGGDGDAYDLPNRDPAFPFHPTYGHTIFAVGPLGSHEELWVPVKPADPRFRDTYANLRHRVGAGMVTVEALTVFRGVVDRLGFKSDELLDAAYPEPLKV